MQLQQGSAASEMGQRLKLRGSNSEPPMSHVGQQAKNSA